MSLEWPRKAWHFVRPEVVTLARRHHWAEAFQWMWYILLGGCLPFWGGTLLLLLFAQSPSWAQVTGRGELALFSTGIFASAIPLMRKRSKRSAVDHPESLFFVCIGLLLVAAFVLSAVTLSARFPSLPKPKETTMIVTSVVLFALSIGIGFIVELTNNVRTDPDLLGLVTDDEGALSRRFNQELGRTND